MHSQHHFGFCEPILIKFAKYIAILATQDLEKIVFDSETGGEVAVG